MSKSENKNRKKTEKKPENKTKAKREKILIRRINSLKSSI